MRRSWSMAGSVPAVHFGCGDSSSAPSADPLVLTVTPVFVDAAVDEASGLFVCRHDIVVQASGGDPGDRALGGLPDVLRGGLLAARGASSTARLPRHPSRTRHPSPRR